MKKITIFLAALLLVFAAGCREDASLDGLESQTKEEGTSAGENAESIAVKEALTYESALEYNWVAEYAPAAGKSYTILFNFLSDSSVATDSPVSENEKNLALFSVSALKEGGVIIKFDGPTMLNDEIVDSEFRERQLIVESTTETTINCIGASSGKPVVLTKATSEDVLKLGEKLVWLALSKKNAMQGVLRDGENKFLARYAVDKKSRSMEFTWIDAANKDAKHESAGFELEVTDTQYGIQWPAVTINGVGYSSLTYTIAGESLAFNVADAKITAVTEAHPGPPDALVGAGFGQVPQHPLLSLCGRHSAARGSLCGRRHDGQLSLRERLYDRSQDRALRQRRRLDSLLRQRAGRLPEDCDRFRDCTPSARRPPT